MIDRKTLMDILEVCTDAIIYVDGDMKISFWNRSAEEMFGWAKESAIGKPLTLVIPLEYNEVYEQILKSFKAKEAHVRKTIELKGLKCNGEEFPIEVYIYPARVREYFVILVVRDITRMKLAEEEIIQLNRKLLALQRISTSVQKSFNLKDSLKEIANGLVESLGYTGSLMGVVDGDAIQIMALASAGPTNEWERIAGTRIEGIRIPIDADENVALKANRKHEIAVTHSIYDVLRPTVSEPICATMQRITGIKAIACIPFVADGKLLGNMLVGSTSNNIMEQEINLLKMFAQQAVIAIEKNALVKGLRESKLKQGQNVSEEKHNVLFDYVGAALAVIEEDKTILKVNKMFEKLSGYSKEEIEGKLTFLDFLPDKKKTHMIMQKNKGDGSMHHEFEFLRKNGEIRHIAMNVQIIPGTKQGVAVLNDITEMKKTESELISKMNELEEWHKLTIDRELRMIELKRRIKELKRYLGRRDEALMLSTKKLCLAKESLSNRE